MSRLFENGVSWYTKATAAVKVSFPEGQVCCRWCRFCKADRGLNRCYCLLTDKIVYEPEFRGLPDGCPLKIEEDENE